MRDVTTMKITTTTIDRLRPLAVDGGSLEDVVVAETLRRVRLTIREITH